MKNIRNIIIGTKLPKSEKVMVEVLNWEREATGPELHCEECGTYHPEIVGRMSRAAQRNYASAKSAPEGYVMKQCRVCRRYAPRLRSIWD